MSAPSPLEQRHKLTSQRSYQVLQYRCDCSTGCLRCARIPPGIDGYGSPSQTPLACVSACADRLRCLYSSLPSTTCCQQNMQLACALGPSKKSAPFVELRQHPAFYTDHPTSLLPTITQSCLTRWLPCAGPGIQRDAFQDKVYPHPHHLNGPR